jgi:cytosine/adenosine deaminase-related metal-dependent hydrolase
LIVHHAGWLLPIAAPPVRDGWVAVDGGRIVSVGDGSVKPAQGLPRGVPPFGSDPYVVLPGVVNAHTHLELSPMAGMIPPAASMPEWAAALVASRRAPGGVQDDQLDAAIAMLRASGTAAIGDVTNTLQPYDRLVDADLSGCVFRELLGFNANDPAGVVADAEAEVDSLVRVDRLRCSVVPHAPYSVSPSLFREIAKVSRGRTVSVHLAESVAEIEFLRTGQGPWRVLLERLGAWDPLWEPPDCGPLEYLDRFGLVSERLLAVHGVQLTDGELGQLARAGATIVTCPRSNEWTGAGRPPIARFYAAGVRVALGTDSLASVADLNLFSEMAAVREIAPDLPAARILESATRSGAEALGFGASLGTIEPDKQAALIAVRVPAGIEDVEEYLVGGIQPADIRWLHETDAPES